jgi:hypothetical protein
MSQNTTMLNLLMDLLPHFNTKQRMIALDMIQSKNNSFKEVGGEIYIKIGTSVFPFIQYVKTKCNCD